MYVFLLTLPSPAQLYGNPLEVLPELSPCASLRHISLANARISADEDFDNWTVEVHVNTLWWATQVARPGVHTFLLQMRAVKASAHMQVAATASYISRAHKLAPLCSLIFHSSVQHSLLAGALAQLAEDQGNCAYIASVGDLLYKQGGCMGLTR